jgi:hypothetical protein
MEKNAQSTDNSSMNTMALNQRLDRLIEIDTKILESSQKTEGHLSTIKIIIIISIIFGLIAVLVSCSGLI